jgi:two-component system, NarL family, sensor kinase
MRAVTRLAGQRRESAVSWLLAGATTLALAAALILLVPNASRIDAGRIGIYAVLAVAVGLYAGTGHLTTRRLPGNAIGWLLSLMGLSLAVTMVAEQYALYGLTRASGPVFLARLTGWFSGMLALLTVFLLVFLVMLFPDGRLPSRPWRPLLWVMLLVVAGGVAAQLQHGETIDGGFTNVLSAAGVSYPNPVGIFPRHG